VNGTLSIPNTNFTAGSLSGSGTIAVTGAGNTSGTRRTLTFGSLNTSTTFSGVITGNANFRKTGTGTLTLNGSGANTYTGFTQIVLGGTLRLGSANRIPDGSDLQLCGNSSFDMNGFNETIAALSSIYFSTTVGSTTSICDGNGHSVTNSSATRTTLTIGLGNGGSGSFTGAITGNLNLVVSGGGGSAAQELSGANTYTGSTSVSGTNAIPGGTFLTISGANALPSTTQVTITSPAQMTLLANAACSTLTLGATPQTAGTYGSTASSATTKNDTFFDVSGTGVLTVSSSPCLLKTSTKTGNWNDPSVWTPAGVPASCDNVRILATHTVTLTGNTLINGNGLGERLTVLGTLNTAGYDLTVNGAITAGTTTSPSGPKTINTGTGGVVTQNSTGTQQTSILITGSGGFTKLGSGATSFNRNQTYTGTTTIGAGTLGIGFNTTTGSISSSSIVNNGTLNLNRSNAYTLAANISGTGNVNKWRNSTVTLSGNNTYTGTTTIGGSVSSGGGGTLVIANANALPAATSVIFSTTNPGKMQLNANVSCASLLYGAVTQPNGSYGSTASAATNQNNTYFSVSGTGVLNAGLFLVPSTFPGGTSIQGRARWGATGFEGGLYIGGTVGPTLNPAGAPVWVIGTAYAFAYGYNGTTGDQTLSIDFNGNNTFDASEVITQSTGFANQGFQHFSIFMSGDATRSISLNNFVVNGVNLGNFVSPTSGNLDLDWVNPSGNFSNITATGTITFTGATGGGAEAGRIWFRTAVPQPLMMAITAERVMEYGSATSMAADAKLAMFPNPNNGEQLTMSLSAVEEGVNTISVDIFDLSGARVSSRTIAVNGGMVQQVLSLGEMAEGLYVVSITAGTQRYTERLVIQK
jgi:autotransporter-associated beta strand protein